MKITKKQLKQVIKEELRALINEADYSEEGSDYPGMMTSLARGAGSKLGVGGVREKEAVQDALSQVLGSYMSIADYLLDDDGNLRTARQGGYTFQNRSVEKYIAELEKQRAQLQQLIEKVGSVSDLPDTFQGPAQLAINAVEHLRTNIQNIQDRGAQNIRDDGDEAQKAKMYISRGQMYENKSRQPTIRQRKRSQRRK